MHQLDGLSTDDAPELPSRGDHFNALVEALRLRAGESVRVVVCESNSGFSFASFTGIVTAIDLDDGVVELRLDDDAHWLRLYADSIERLTVDRCGIEIEHAAGNVSITPVDA